MKHEYNIDLHHDVETLKTKNEDLVKENCFLREMLEQAAQIFWENTLLPHNRAASEWLHRWRGITQVYGRVKMGDDFTGDIQIR